MTIGRRPRGALGIAAGMSGFVEQRRIVDAARLAIKSSVGGARDRDRGLEAACRINVRQNDTRERAAVRGLRRSAELFDRLRQAPQRESLAGAGRPRDRRQKRRLNLGRRAELSQWLNDFGGVQEVRPISRIAEENRLGLDRRRRRRARGGRVRMGPHRQRERRLVVGRAPAEQANLRIHAGLGQSSLRGARSGDPARGAIDLSARQ